MRRRRKNTFPLHIEQMMANIYGSAIRRLAKDAMRTIKNKYREEYHNTPAVVMIKADESFREMIANLIEEYTAYLVLKNMQYKIERASMALRAWSFRMVKDSFDVIKNLQKKDFALLAIEQALDSPFIQAVGENFIKTNMELVELAGKEYIAGISDVAMDTFLKGGSMDDLAESMLEYTDGDAAKAEFWARDQVGDAYASYTETLHKEAGIENFIWRTVGDNHVRKEHAELEGRIFTNTRGVSAGILSKPGAKLPGQDYNCRCTMEPTMEEQSNEEVEVIE
jgi:SPP1 gp7 family putative phage head morphogenesis protein